MKQLPLLLFAIVAAKLNPVFGTETCDSDIQSFCSATAQNEDVSVTCSALSSEFQKLKGLLNSYANQALYLNFRYLLMSVQFANYEKQREGFSKLYRKLSDSTWEDAIDIIKHLGKRGEKADELSVNLAKEASQQKGMSELESLSWALKEHKDLAKQANVIHSEFLKHNKHDAETVSFMEEKFVHKQARVIRDLAGYTNDLVNIIKEKKDDPSLGVFMFDEYLQKAL